jgi:hypothetical protein
MPTINKNTEISKRATTDEWLTNLSKTEETYYKDGYRVGNMWENHMYLTHLCYRPIHHGQLKILLLGDEAFFDGVNKNTHLSEDVMEHHHRYQNSTEWYSRN